jgi:hypothetical protein
VLTLRGYLLAPVPLVRQDDLGGGRAVGVVPHVVVHYVVIGAAELVLFGVDARVVRVGADELDLVSGQPAFGAVLAGR